jgi:pilus assembly protein CpaE
LSTETNTLLPAARVDIFIKDKETIDAARAISDDWRFARVNVNVEEGDVETAIMSYQEAKSPSLVIIETQSTGDDFIEKLGELSGHCEEETNAIVIGPVNDVTLYRNLTSMGVSDYLVKPVPLETLTEVIAKALIEQLGTSGSRLIGVVGAKGGVGTSSLTQALAWGISENLDQKTFLMDAAGGWSTLSVGMGFEASTTLQEAVRAAENDDEDTLNRMFHKANERLTVLASGSDSMLETSVTAAQYEHMIDLLMQSYPVVLVDLSGAIPSLKRAVLSKAHQTMIVSTATLPSLRAARTLIQELKLIHGGDTSHIDLITNMVGVMPSKEVPKKDIAAALEHEPSALIPYDPPLFIGSENEGKKINASKSGKEIIDKLMPLAQKVVTGAPIASNTNNADDPVSQILNKVGLGSLLGKG